MEEHAARHEPEAPPLAPESEGVRNLECLHDHHHSVVDPHRKMLGSHPERKGCRPHVLKRKQKHRTSLPIGESEFLNADAEVRGGDLEGNNPLDQYRRFLPCEERSVFAFHIHGESFAGTREDKEERKEEEESVIGSSHVVVRHVHLVDEEEESDERARARACSQRKTQWIRTLLLFPLRV